MHTLLQLEEKIKSLEDKNLRGLFLGLLQKKDFNRMFQLAAIKAENLAIIKFLYLHRDTLQINVNKKGSSEKNALEIAIEKNAKETVIFLLTLKEIKVDDLIRSKIFEKFGDDFRTVNITPYYLPLCNQLVQDSSKISILTQEYSTKTSSITRETTAKLTHALVQLKAKNKNVNKAEMYNEILFHIKNLVEQYEKEINLLSQVYDQYEELYCHYLPYSYAQEKLLQGNEFAKNNLDSSMKNTCLENRKQFEERITILQHSKNSLICHIEKALTLFIVVLTFQAANEEKNKPKIVSLNEKVVQPRPQETLKEPVSELKQPKLEKPTNTPSNTIKQESTLAEELPASKISSAPNKKPTKTQSPSNEIHCKAKVVQGSSKQAIATKQKTVVMTPTNNRLERLQQFAGELAALKQKGQVKLSAFLNIIQNVGKEVDLEIKSTKSGIMVSQAENRFSFHLPHKNDKGVDKEALRNMESLVENARSTLSS